MKKLSTFISESDDILKAVHMTLANSKDIDVILSLALNKNIHPDVLDHIAKTSTDWTAHYSVAKHPNTSEKTLMRLADPSSGMGVHNTAQANLISRRRNA